ncbi:MAG: 2-amino-4-hydroxy-6-hydroxymethyldihydropteridine diphosphokinase [Sphingobacteriales bacterium]|uniref:2-amino-4-hydroxy-6- hydroxymethyldihydropteridine diphosphokinase n=1 Tax=Hydrotalea flava TaxID=714549 RepID=UPI000FC1430E|nr:2-amino-4-hydroxy-6-hydroxymethyldihydropteridine diphosphokinase [Hydrotalea flava]RTL52085.1 MAG: 2-amino-4-hydroxy-6-hydroxymethyldihydropteridine diphosphokinase [Sphingobacteriales bacterium]
MATTTAYILLGSNLGNRIAFIHAAINEIEKQCGQLIAASSIYETEAWGVEQQPPYLNQVIAITTSLLPEQLMQTLLDIELQLGRKRTKRFAERTIDLDILLINNLIIYTSLLTVPHPAMQQRKFVLLPLQEIAPQIIHPLTQLSITEMLQACTDTLRVEKIENHT